MAPTPPALPLPAASVLALLSAPSPIASGPMVVSSGMYVRRMMFIITVRCTSSIIFCHRTVVNDAIMTRLRLFW
jgi:hypothetical protein